MEDPAAAAPAVQPADAVKQEEAPVVIVGQSEQPSAQDSQPRETESLVQNLDALQLKDQQKQQPSSLNRIRQDEDKDLASAKQWMMEKKGKEGKSLYDHLVKVVSKLVDEKPQNALGISLDTHLPSRLANTM